VNHTIAILDGLTIACWCIALVGLCIRRRNDFEARVRLILGGLVAFSLVYSAIVFSGWAGLTGNLEHFEDLFGAPCPYGGPSRSLHSATSSSATTCGAARPN